MHTQAERVSGLSEHDISRLANSSVEQRVKLTRQLVSAYHRDAAPPAYRQAAEEVFRLLMRDVSTDVRGTFAELVKSSASVPRDVVRTLASDVEPVSAPVLEFSGLLTDEDILEVIGASRGSVGKLTAVSRRKRVSLPVSAALVGTEHAAVAAALVGNRGAEIGGKEYEALARRHAGDGAVVEALIARDGLPAVVADFVAARVSPQLLKSLAERNPALSPAIRDIAKRGAASEAAEYAAFLQKAERMGLAKESVPLAALSLAKTAWFEAYMARALNLPVLNVRALVADPSNKGFKALYERAGLPSRLYAAAALLMESVRDLHLFRDADAPSSGAEIANRLIEEMTERAAERDEEIENLDYIVAMIRHSRRLTAN
jgi:uncharacterized protein (DUF2336 family)